MTSQTEDTRQQASRGASSMVSAVFLAKVLGIFMIVPMQNLLGDYALGLYQLVYPLYTIMLTLSTAGFPIALSKTISQLNTQGKVREASQTYAIVGRTLLLFGLVAAVLMWFGGPYLLSWSVASPQILHDAIPAIHALAPALLLLPLMSAQRGYLQGNLRLEPSGASQVVEQFVRVGVVLIGLVIAVHFGASDSFTAAIATFGGTAGAVGGFILLLAAVKKTRRMNLRRVRYSTVTQLHTGPVLKQLFIYSLPIALGTLILPISQNIDNATVVRELIHGGMSDVAATEQYGVYAGVALRLMQLPLSFATAIGASIMPAITEALSRGLHLESRIRFISALRMTAFVTLPAAVTLGVMAGPINTALFPSAAGTGVIAIAAVISLFSALELVTTFILQGYDRFYQPVVHMAIGAVIKFAGNVFLIPILGIKGAALASVIGYAVSSWLNVNTLRQASGHPLSIPMLTWRSGMAAVLTGLWMFALTRLYQPVALVLHASDSRLLATAFVLLGLLIGAPIYLIAALWLRAIQPHELSRLPVAGRLLNRFLTRTSANVR
ncbi:MAG: polysaccharide biosynthesis protein [Firmicutes bacterium]|nr:polysaccharide biosynthesis protein [Bacillota bacterium]